MANRRAAIAVPEEFAGKLLLENGDLPAARVALSAAKAAAPNSFGVDLSLVQLDISESKLDDAAAKLHTVVSKDPKNSTAYLWLGNLAETKGDHSAAKEQYRKAVEANPASALTKNDPLVLG
jgi:tetratricopeptide (TPR) repeat protein